jgi:hypothetical protein
MRAVRQVGRQQLQALGEHHAALGALPGAGYHLCTETSSQHERLGTRVTVRQGRYMRVGGLSGGPQGEHQWKHNVSICPLAVCIVLDA